MRVGSHAQLGLVLASALGAGSGCGRVGFDAEARTGDGGPADVAAVDAVAAADAAAVVCPGEPGPQLDEDGDGVGNPCDACPHVADPAQADGDGDQVGDACDPAPASPRQRITFFDGFDEVRPEWTGARTMGASYARASVVGDGSTLRLAVPITASRIVVVGEVFGVGTTEPFQHLFVGADTGASLYYVEVIDDGTGRRRSLMRDQQSMYTEYDTQLEGGPLEPGPFRIRLALDEATLAGGIEYAGADIGLRAATEPAPVAPNAVVWIGDLDVKLYSVTVITTE